MQETIISSSILIIILISLRFMLKGKINPRLQYALWLLVAIRLLLPFSVFDSSLSVMNVINLREDVGLTEAKLLTGPKDNFQATDFTPGLIGNADDGEKAEPVLHNKPLGLTTNNEAKAGSKSLTYFIWLAGALIIGLWFVFQNIWFYGRLRKTRRKIRLIDSRLPVYQSTVIKSPCLFGLRPAIYIHPGGLIEGESLKFILAHEETHYRHGDHLWSYVRCLCLALHWFNPLVWWAAVLSRRDCEIACDESTLNRIGNEHRKAYGNTLINLVERRSRPTDLLLGATTMTSGKSGIKERVNMIVQKPKMLLSTLLITILILALAIGCTFTGGKNASKEEWFPQPEIEDQDKYWEALEKANKSIKTEEISVEDLGDREAIARAWMDEYFAMFKALPKDNMARITEGIVDSLDIKAISKEGLPKAFVFTVTFSVRPTYPIANNSFWMVGNTGESPGRDETWGQMYREVVLRLSSDGQYHYSEMGTGGYGHSFDFILLETPQPTDEVIYPRPPEGGQTWLYVDEAPTEVTLYERSGISIAIPNKYEDQLLIDPIDYTDENTLMMLYQKSTYEKYENDDGLGFLFSIIHFTRAQYEQFLCADGSGYGFFATDGNSYYGLFSATDVRAPEDYEAYSELFSSLSNFVKNDIMNRNGLTPVNDDALINKEYTYSSQHIALNYYPYLAYTGSRDVTWTLILSQPVEQGETGIWCVERWQDENDNLYLYFPDENGVSSAEYYAKIQADSDSGADKSWLDPKQAALEFVKKKFEHNSATVDSFSIED